MGIFLVFVEVVHIGSTTYFYPWTFFPRYEKDIA